MGLLIPDYGWTATLAGIPCHSFAWGTLNLAEFRAVAIRGTNTTMGGRDGTRGNRSFRDEFRVVLDTLFVGDCEWDDETPVADPAAQLETTLAYWVENVIDATQDDRDCSLFTAAFVDYGWRYCYGRNFKSFWGNF